MLDEKGEYECMKKITFSGIRRLSARRIEFACTEEIDGAVAVYDDLFYEFNVDNEPSNDALAISFSALLGRSFYDEICIELALSQSVVSCLASFNRARVISKDIVPPPQLLFDVIKRQLTISL